VETQSKVVSNQGIGRDAIAFPTFLTFVLSLPIFGVVMGVGEATSEVLAYAIWCVANFALCFFMVRKYPKSTWVLWFPCNLLVFVAAVLEPNFWITDMWKAHAGVVVLSIAGSALGGLLKKKAAQFVTDSPLSGNQ
jgi:hypothetical protein